MLHFISGKVTSKYSGVTIYSKTNQWEVKRSFKGNFAYGGRFPREEEKKAAKKSDELVFKHLENGGKLWGKTKINFRDDRLQNLDKTTAELISIIDESDIENSDSEDQIPLKSSTGTLLLTSKFFVNLFSNTHMHAISAIFHGYLLSIRV